jgi:hypothetical protein
MLWVQIPPGPLLEFKECPGGASLEWPLGSQPRDRGFKSHPGYWGRSDSEDRLRRWCSIPKWSRGQAVTLEIRRFKSARTPHWRKIRNPNIEIRSTKGDVETAAAISDFVLRISDLFRISIFGFRVWIFGSDASWETSWSVKPMCTATRWVRFPLDPLRGSSAAATPGSEPGCRWFESIPRSFGFRTLVFGFVSDFDIRISDFGFQRGH